ncbi:sugar phosphate isomerase/epimerase [Arthrobacter agilis]|uniref:sugar phosphate isomerase/epimerase family protein n=1 Tax=Arthrobacter agilis TaxID=37921 RepID=UPI000B35541E|nr:sugar phosphate isomerase/epimerase family protein [Arthrobacter agilis]OUM41495.1 xylose isomerase [Arthrobacter agilis]PPB46175.1 sugar phosphate isomerase/epimerase [Arthrobacter agilis]TPV26929.1 sugar phosphate isomerase/epimerase [Arthrobacter agilis]VDR32943.1 Inosose isomerase [Arthrobacter agilis]
MSTAPHDRLSINQATIKYAPLAEALAVTADAGIGSIGLWRDSVQAVSLPEAARLLTRSGLRFSSLCRGGFFTVPEGPARRSAMEDNRRAIEETARLADAGAPGSAAVLVMVAGGLPQGSRDIAGARSMVEDALAELAPVAAAAGVRLALEPLHPMYAADRAVISTLGQALDLAAPFDPAVVGVVVDTFHVWWDPDLDAQIARAGREDRIASYQVCDWRTPLEADVLLSRHYPGAGIVDFASITTAVERVGYRGDVEVEIFNQEIWDTAPATAVARTIDGFQSAVAPHLAARYAGARR